MIIDLDTLEHLIKTDNELCEERRTQVLDAILAIDAAIAFGGYDAALISL